MVVCQLGTGQALYAEAGKFLWKTTNVSTETRLGGVPAEGSSGGGGFLEKAMDTAAVVGKRALAGATPTADDASPAGGAATATEGGDFSIDEL